MLRLYDTRRRAIAPVRARGRRFTMYVCGVTPYDTTHLGHARTFLTFDVIARLLEATGHPVRYVQNVTDIDESILQRAARDHVGWRELGRREERAYLADMRKLGWRKPDVICHATMELPAMFALIRALGRRKAAYVLPRGVYFPVGADPRYGQLSRLPPAAMRRILAGQDDAELEDSGRRDPRDFALWRFVDDGPTWAHVAPMQLGGKKMSKSDGNMVFVRDALKTTDPRALRLYLLDRHYRKPFDHDEALLDRARLRQKALADALGRAPIGPIGRDRDSRAALAALENDLDVPRAVRIIERSAPGADAATRASLHAVARIVGVA